MKRRLFLAAVLAGLSGMAARAGEPPFAYTRSSAQTRGALVRSGDGKSERKFPEANDPAISPDGKLMVCTLNQKAGRRLAIIEIATGKTRLLPIEGLEIYGGLWSPNGDWIAFNHFTEKTHWNVGVIRPDGTGLRIVTESLKKENGVYLAGWNQKTSEPLMQDLETIWQFSLEGQKVWERNLPKLVGTSSIDSGCHYWVRPDGRTLVGCVEVDEDEIKGLDGPSNYLVEADLESGHHERITPKGMSASQPFLTYDGRAVIFQGFVAADVKAGKGDSLQLKIRAYRQDLESRKITTLFQDAWGPTQAAVEAK